jgi:dTDP-4-dehydrorhamnose reductase
MRVVVFGANGMLGKSLLRELAGDPSLEILGLMRGDPAASRPIAPPSRSNAIVEVSDMSDDGALLQRLRVFRPDAMINCVGWRRRPQGPAEAAAMIIANSVLPHRLAMMAGDLCARLIHISSDGVFSGRMGGYREENAPDPIDAYGRSKLLGEPDHPLCLSLRLSLIGHASKDSDQLVDWLLRQRGNVNGYRKAIFTGLPTVEVARVIRKVILPRPDLAGVWHLAAAPISKFELLKLIAARYGVDVEITPLDRPAIDRSLDGSRLRDATGYVAPPWPQLVDGMHEFR